MPNSTNKVTAKCVVETIPTMGSITFSVGDKVVTVNDMLLNIRLRALAEKGWSIYRLPECMEWEAQNVFGDLPINPEYYVTLEEALTWAEGQK